MSTKIKKTALTRIGAVLPALVCFVVLTVFSEEVRSGIVRGTELCLKTLIPSLFPFMAATNLFIKSGAGSAAHRLFGAPCKLLFGINGSFASALLLGLAGGYPVGAAAIRELHSQGALSGDESRKASLFTVCAGPGFLISFVGQSVYGSTKTGAVLLTAQIISTLLTGIAANLLFKTDASSRGTVAPQRLPFSSAVVQSVRAAATGMLVICGFVTLFSSIAEIINVHAGNAACVLLPMLEVCAAVTRLSEEYPIELIAFALGFGGLCVHLQILSALGDIKISYPLFFIFRIAQGTICAAFTHFALRLLFEEEQVFSTNQVNGADFFGGSALSGAALIGASICFLISLKQYKRR